MGVSRKYLVTQLRECQKCSLLFRVPTDNPRNNLRYYESEYSQGFTTEIPSDDTLAELLKDSFAGKEKDWSYYNRVLGMLGLAAGARLFDFGCSWGYGSWQMARAGLTVVASDVAPSRLRFAAERLGVTTIDDAEAAADPRLAASFDCFFSAHVLEHVPRPSAVFDFARRLLRPGGLFVSFTPNGCAAARKVQANWEKWWGEVHPNFINDRFLDRAFADCPRVIGSSPVTSVSFPAAPVLQRLDDLRGAELFFAARVGRFGSA